MNKLRLGKILKKASPKVTVWNAEECSTQHGLHFFYTILALVASFMKSPVAQRRGDLRLRNHTKWVQSRAREQGRFVNETKMKTTVGNLESEDQ